MAQTASATEEIGETDDWGELEQLRVELLQLPEATVCEPTGRLATFVGDAARLYSTLQRASLRAKLTAVGLDARRVEALGAAIEAVRLSQSRLLWARSPDAEFAEALESALELREELNAACHWNLRARDVGAALVRISDSSDCVELAIDLRELAQLVTDHASDFDVDESFDAAGSVRQALALADELNAIADRVAPVAVVEMRDRAFTHLADLVDEIRHAGSYAFRRDPEGCAVFVVDGQCRRRRSRLRSMVDSVGA